MAPAKATFARLLTVAIQRIRIEEGTSVAVVQDELGYALGREGGTAIEYWRKGHVPASADDVALLARELRRRGGLTPAELAAFVRSAGHPDPGGLVAALLGPQAVAPQQPAPALAPFVVGPPVMHPRQFWGRERELRRIFAVVGRLPLQNVAIVGPQRSGKTSLLHHLPALATTPAEELRPDQRREWLRQPASYRWLFIDFQDPRLCRREGLLRRLLAGFGLDEGGAGDLDSFMDVASGRITQPTVVLMDEIGAALRSPELDQELWWALRSLGTNQSGGKLGFVLAAHDLPGRLAHDAGKPSPFFNIFGHTLALGPFNRDEANALIASAPLPFDEGDRDWIIDQSGGWPALLQLFCHLRLLALEEGALGDEWRADALQQAAPLRAALMGGRE